MTVARSKYHRTSQSPLLVQPVIRLLAQLRDTITGKEIRRDTLSGRLVGHRLGAILAELKRMPVVIRIRPCTARTVEPGLLINREPRASHPNWAHLAEPVSKRMNYRRDTRGYLGDSSYLQTPGRFRYPIRYKAMNIASFIFLLGCHREISCLRLLQLLSAYSPPM